MENPKRGNPEGTKGRATIVIGSITAMAPSTEPHVVWLLYVIVTRWRVRRLLLAILFIDISLQTLPLLLCICDPPDLVFLMRILVVVSPSPHSWDNESFILD